MKIKIVFTNGKKIIHKSMRQFVYDAVKEAVNDLIGELEYYGATKNGSKIYRGYSERKGYFLVYRLG